MLECFEFEMGSVGGCQVGVGVVWKWHLCPGSASATLPCEAAAAAICLFGMVVVGGTKMMRVDNNFMVWL